MATFHWRVVSIISNPYGMCMLQVPANYASLSPDGSLLCSVGDSTTGHLHARTESGFALCGSFSEAGDAGMGCDWAPGGSCLAAAFQDGTVLIYDHRSGKAVHK